MIPLPSAISSGLTWSSTTRSRSYELKLNAEVVGTLQRPNFWSTEYLAESLAGRWTFRHSGFLCSGAEIVDTSSKQVMATFKSEWGNGGTLTFADGQTFELRRAGWWRPVWSAIAGGGQPVMLLHRREKTVELPAGTGEARLTLLLLFTWYRVLQAEEDAASAAMVAVIAS